MIIHALRKLRVSIVKSHYGRRSADVRRGLTFVFAGVAAGVTVAVGKTVTLRSATLCFGYRY